MLPELTPAVVRAVEAARRYALSHGSAEVEPVHLLHGLLEEEEGRAAALVIAAGLDNSAYRASLPPLKDASGELSAVPLHKQTEAALFAARRLARDLAGESTVASESLLLALFQTDTRLSEAMEPFGFRVAQLEADLLAQRQPPPQLEDSLQLADVTQRMDTARILDACGNRAREGLRVIEDYCRFVLGDAFLTRNLKQLRHDLAETLAELAADWLLGARDTQADVGTDISTEQEGERASPGEVVQVNLKRLQEALRSLEEFGKVHNARLGLALEQLRYRTYTLERAIVVGTSARKRLQEARLYVLLSGAQCAAALDWTIAEAAAGGVQVVQLREKNLNDRALWERARQVRRWTRQAGVLFILNDRPDLARLVEADGVHLGQDDLPVQEARRILGPDALIGVSTHNLEQLRQAILDGASYVGVGPTFHSGTKDFSEFPGLAFVRQAMAETTLPAFVIGGVNLNTIEAAVSAGARRVAVSQAIAAADDPRLVAATLWEALPEISSLRTEITGADRAAFSGEAKESGG
jgi:thiamine-phosphate pyrophosphorylase